MKANFHSVEPEANHLHLGSRRSLRTGTDFPALRACIHHGIPTAKPERIVENNTLPHRAGEDASDAYAHRPAAIPKSLANVARATATTSAKPAAARASVSLAATKFHLHPLEQALEDIPFADKPGLGRQCGQLMLQRVHHTKKKAVFRNNPVCWSVAALTE